MQNKKTVPQGAATTLRCVSMTDAEIQGGHYYVNCVSGNDAGKLQGAAKESLSKQYDDYDRDSLEAKLWKLSEILVTERGFKMTL